jgi:hypothetical protein
MDQTQIRDLRDLTRPAARARSDHDFPDQANVEPPLDIAVVAPGNLVAPRVVFPRRPPEMVLTWAAPEQAEVPVVNADVALVSGLPTPELAYRLASLAARIEEQVQYSGTPEALTGLGVLSMQARMYEHLHLLQSGAGGTL